MKIVLATRNRHKVDEIARILEGLPVEFSVLNDYPAIPEIVEDGKTLEENALKKARVVRDATGLPVLADDSGLEVEVLSGRPGVHSSRFAGPKATYEQNNTKLLSLLEGLPNEKRTARFRCIMALALTEELREMIKERQPLGELERWRGFQRQGELDAILTEGIVWGRIAKAPRGRSGFGYDPVFELPEEGRTFAEMTPEEKNQRSHRYRALIEMRRILEAILAGS